METQSSALRQPAKGSSNAAAHTYQWDAEGRVGSVDSGSTWGFTYDAGRDRNNTMHRSDEFRRAAWTKNDKNCTPESAEPGRAFNG